MRTCRKCAFPPILIRSLFSLLAAVVVEGNGDDAAVKHARGSEVSSAEVDSRPRWLAGPWEPCAPSCGESERSRLVTCSADTSSWMLCNLAGPLPAAQEICWDFSACSSWFCPLGSYRLFEYDVSCDVQAGAILAIILVMIVILSYPLRFQFFKVTATARDLEAAEYVHKDTNAQLEPALGRKVHDDGVAVGSSALTSRCDIGGSSKIVENLVHVEYSGENIVSIGYRSNVDTSQEFNASSSEARRSAGNFWDDDHLGIVSAEAPMPDVDSRLLGTWHCSTSNGLNVDALRIDMARDGNMTIDVLVPCYQAPQHGTPTHATITHLTGTLEPVGALGVSNLCFESSAYPIEGGETSGSIRVRVDLTTGLLHFSHKLFGAQWWSNELTFFSLGSDLEGEIQRFPCQRTDRGSSISGRRLPAKLGWSPLHESSPSTSSRAPQERLHMRPDHNNMGPGVYYVADDRLPVTTGIRASFDSVLCELSRGTMVRVLEVQHCSEQRTIRGRIAEPSGWIPLRHMENGHAWVTRPQSAEKTPVENLLVGCAACGMESPTGEQVTLDHHHNRYHDLGSKHGDFFQADEIREPIIQLVGECASIPACSSSGWAGDRKELVRSSAFDEPLSR